MCKRDACLPSLKTHIANIVSDLTAAIGPIKTGSVQFGEFVVPNQAFSTYGLYFSKPIQT